MSLITPEQASRAYFGAVKAPECPSTLKFFEFLLVHTYAGWANTDRGDGWEKAYSHAIEHGEYLDRGWASEFCADTAVEALVNFAGDPEELTLDVLLAWSAILPEVPGLNDAIDRAFLRGWGRGYWASLAVGLREQRLAVTRVIAAVKGGW